MMRRTRLLFCLVFLISGLASAQDYAVRVTYNTNLRASYSLQSRILDTAPAGTTLTVVDAYNRWLRVNRSGNTAWLADWVPMTRLAAPTSVAPDVDNCCFVDRQCQSDQEWTAGYWAFQQGQCGAPSQSTETTSQQPVSQTPANVNNCCFVDRHCATDQEWTAGYRAFQNNQCGAPSQSAATSTQGPDSETPANANNCCFLDWVCHSDHDWNRGFYAYQSNQCAHGGPQGGIRIEGSPAFVANIERALDFLRDRSSKWYGYLLSGLDLVKQVPPPSIGVYVHRRTFELNGHNDIVPPHDKWRFDGYTASVLVHEACHVHRYEAGLVWDGLVGETACVETEVAMLSELAPDNRHIDFARGVLANIHRPECQWWHGEYKTCS